MIMEVALAEVCDIRSGGTPSRGKKEYYGGQIPWAKIGDLESAEQVVRTEEYISDEGLRAIRGRLFPAGTLLFAIYGSMGKMAFAGTELATNQAILGIQPLADHQIDLRYLYHYLSQRVSDMQADGRGVTQKNLSATYVRELRVPLPKIDQQRRMSAILDKAEVIRRKRKQALRLAESLINSAFLVLFGDPLSNPKNWPVRPLGEYIEEIRYGTSTKCGDTKGESDVAVLRIPNVIDGAISWENLKFTDLPQREIERLSMRRGDILFVRTNGNPDYIGRCAVFDSDDEAVFASYLIRARLRSDSPVTPLHVRTAISMPSYRHRVVQEAKTTAGNYNVNIQGLSSLPIIEPPLGLQVTFSKFVVKTMLMAKRKDYALKQANDLLGTLSGRAFRGEL